MFDVGRICMKTAGREAGKFCVIVDVLEEGFVLVTGPKAVTHVKRRKCNIEHLEPTPEVIKIGKNASDDDVMSAYKKQGVIEKLAKKLPSEKDIEMAMEAERKRIAARKKEEGAVEAIVKEELKEEAKAELAPEEPKPAKKKVPAKKKAEKKGHKEAEHAPHAAEKHEDKPKKEKPAKKPAVKKAAKKEKAEK